MAAEAMAQERVGMVDSLEFSEAGQAGVEAKKLLVGLPLLMVVLVVAGILEANGHPEQVREIPVVQAMVEVTQ